MPINSRTYGKKSRQYRTARKFVLWAALFAGLCVMAACAVLMSDTRAKAVPVGAERVQGDTLNIAHRGARSLAPENTLAAAEKGLEAGADLWELDVRLTADKELIVLHDDTLSRTSNAESEYPDREPWNTADFTLSEMRTLDFGSWFNESDPFGQIAAGEVSASDIQSYEGLYAPSLREALEWTRRNNWKVNVELKNLQGQSGEDEFAERVVSLVQELGMEEEVMISSFKHEYLVRVKEADSSIPTGVLAGRAIDNPARYVRRLGASSYNPSSEAVAASKIDAIREAGIDVYVYTVNEEAELIKFLDASASGVFTDFPQRLTQIIDRR
ncbi:MAG: glycerophosphodiester phosphodiesterase family protein [Spirochaetia bacterium]